jgi:hypothetical protein
MLTAVTDKVAADEQAGQVNEDSDPRSPRLGKVLGLWLAAIGFVIGSRVISDNSFLTHLATGRLILDEGAVPNTDPYSFTANGEPWVVQSWLVSVIYAAGLEIGEWTLRLMHGVLAAVAAFNIWRLSEPTKNLLMRFLLVGLVMILAASLWFPRPLLFAVVCFVAVQLSLEGKLNPAWLVPIMWVWVNSHGSFPMAGVLAGTVMVGTYLDTRSAPVAEMKVLGYVTLGTALGAVNPLGPKLLWFPVQLLSEGNEKLHNVVEWQPLGFEHPMVLWPLAGLGVLLVLAVTKGARWRSLVPSVVFLIAALLAVRNAGMAGLVFSVAIAHWLPDPGGTLRAGTRSPVSKILGVGAVCFAAVGLMVAITQGALGLTSYPTDELAWLDEQGLVANPDVQIIAEVPTGNLLTLQHGRDAQVFFDDRFDMYPLELNRAYDTLVAEDPDAFRNTLATYEADVVVWSTENSFSDWLIADSEWEVVLSGEDFVVVCRAEFHCR